jgi:hypothetical protein
MVIWILVASLLCLLGTMYTLRDITLKKIVERSRYILREYADYNRYEIHKHALILSDPNDDRKDSEVLIVSKKELGVLLVKHIGVALCFFFPALFAMFSHIGVDLISALFCSAFCSAILAVPSTVLLGLYNPIGQNDGEDRLAERIFGKPKETGLSDIMLDATEYELAKYERENRDSIIAKMPEDTKEEKKAKALAKVRIILDEVNGPLNITKRRPKNISQKET